VYYYDDKRKTWYFKTRYKDRYGQAKQKMRRGFKGKREAKLAEAEFLANIKDAFTSNVTLDEVFEHNLTIKEYAASTVRKKQDVYKNHIQPFFKDLKIKDITQKHVLGFRQDISVRLAASTSNTVYRHLKALINHAKTFYGLAIDPALGVPSIKVDDTRFNFITQQDFDKITKNMADKKHYKQLTILLFYTGLRVGEAMALRWRNVHLAKQNLFVEHTLDKVTRGISKPKTKASRNFVPYPDFVADMLRDIKEQASKDYYKFNDDYFVFGGSDTYSYTPYREYFVSYFKNMRIHDLRHSYASHLINSGVDIYLVKELLRHTTIKQTADTYGHLYDDRKQSAMQAFKS